MAFPQDMRLNSGAILTARKDKADFVPYEFVGYKGVSSISYLIHNQEPFMVSHAAQTLSMRKSRQSSKAACHRQWNGSGKPWYLDLMTLGFIDSLSNM